MKQKTKKTKKTLRLARETLTTLSPTVLPRIAGGSGSICARCDTCGISIASK